MKNTVTAVFPAALEEVLLECGFKDIEVTAAEAATDPIQFSVSIGITGQLRGFFTVQSTRNTALNVAHEFGRMMEIDMGSTPTMDEMHRAALSELANQISGRATIHLAEAGVDADITPPTLMSGEALRVQLPDQIEGAAFDVRLPHGILYCELRAQLVN